jgi:Tol biopolymer transport system component
MTPKLPHLKPAFCAFLFLSFLLAILLLNSSATLPASAQMQAVNGRIAFTSGNSLFTINPDGSGHMTVSSEGGVIHHGPTWKPDGTKITFGRRGPLETNFSIHTINPDGSGLQKISSVPANDTEPTWSPDGSKIAFNNAITGSEEIAVMNADGSNRVNLTNNSAVDINPVWSPDGTRIAFTSNRDFPGLTGDISRGFEIYVMNADGSNQVRLTNNMFSDSNPSWSPDSNKIAFDTTRDGNFEIYSMNANGSNQINLTNHSSSDFGPVWSPDGNRIAFLSFRESVMNIPQEIFQMNSDGSNPTRVTTSSIGENELAWQALSGAPTPTPTPTPTPSPSPSPLVVISQVYGGGGTPGATHQASFVELFNRGVVAVDMNQWSLRVTTDTGMFNTATSFVSSGSIPLLPGQYMLVQVGSPGANGAPLQANFFALAELGTSGKVMLVKPNSSVPFTGCPLPNSGIADFIGFGNNANCFEGTAPIGTLANTTAALRKAGGCTDNDQNVNDLQTGSPTPRNLSSPLNPCNLSDDVDFFVRQHYADFLNRQPDPTGLAFWKNEILSCADSATCVEIKRINVSAAFYLSIEFQQTGFLVYRSYKAAYGLIAGTPVPLRFNEFLPDTQEIGQNVIVGAPGWEDQLGNNKEAFFADFVTRQRFTNAFDTSLNPAAFVDALFANEGITPSASDRNASINEFGGANNIADSSARARAFRRVAENSSFAQAEFNRAFVLMQYFGYLRRNPNDAPEPNVDFAGYNFWLNKLNQFGGNFIDAEMVKAFISSTEYRQRFGP